MVAAIMPDACSTLVTLSVNENVLFSRFPITAA